MVSDIYRLWGLGPEVKQKIMRSDYVGVVVACLMVAGAEERAGNKNQPHSSFSKVPFLNSHNLPIYHILMNLSED